MKKREYNPEDFKYLRPGHVDLDRLCDHVVKHAVRILPGGVLPSRWAYRSKENFLEKYGDLGDIVWAQTASYHLLILKGERVFRIWTDSPESVLVDIHEKLVSPLSDLFEIWDIPESTWRKTKPFRKRFTLNTQTEVNVLILSAVMLFGAEKC